MIAIVLQRNGAIIGSWTVQDWVGDADAMQSLADETDCVITIVPLAKVQPLDPADIARRMRARVADPGQLSIRVYRRRPPPAAMFVDEEELPL